MIGDEWEMEEVHARAPSTMAGEATISEGGHARSHRTEIPILRKDAVEMELQ